MHLGRSALQRPFFPARGQKHTLLLGKSEFWSFNPGAIRRMSLSFGMYRKGYEKIFEVHPAMLIQRSQFPFSLVELRL